MCLLFLELTFFLLCLAFLPLFPVAEDRRSWERGISATSALDGFGVMPLAGRGTISGVPVCVQEGNFSSLGSDLYSSVFFSLQFTLNYQMPGACLYFFEWQGPHGPPHISGKILPQGLENAR